MLNSIAHKPALLPCTAGFSALIAFLVYTGAISISLVTFYRKFAKHIYKKGEVLIRADNDPQGIFCLTSGLVRQFTISPTGTELTLTILKPLSYFPLNWAMNGAPNLYHFEALTVVEVARAPRESVIAFIADKPEVVLALLQELLTEYAESLMRIEHLVFSDAYRRVISVLLYLAKHFSEAHGDGVIVQHWFTQQDIATLVGVARETASSELNKLERMNLIAYEDHALLIKDIPLLQAELFQ